MHHTGHRRISSIFDVGRCPGDGAGGGDPAEQGRGGIADALGHQLHVGVVPPANHLIGHHTGQQGLDGRQNSDGECVRQDRRHRLIGQGRQGKPGQAAGDGIQVPNGVHRQLQQAHHGRRGDHRHQRCGHPLKKAGPDDLDRQGDTAHHQGPQIDGIEAGNKFLHFLHSLDGSVPEGHPEEILQLPHHDGHRDAGGKACGDGIGDELDHAAHAEQSHEHQQDPSQNGGNRQAVHPVSGHDPRYDGGEGRCGPGDLYLAPAQGGHQKARHDGGIQALFRGHPRGQGQRDRQGQRDDRHNDAGDQVLHQLFPGIVLQGAQQLRTQFFHVLSLLFLLRADRSRGALPVDRSFLTVFLHTSLIIRDTEEKSK